MSDDEDFVPTFNAAAMKSRAMKAASSAAERSVTQQAMASAMLGAETAAVSLDIKRDALPDVDDASTYETRRNAWIQRNESRATAFYSELERRSTGE